MMLSYLSYEATVSISSSVSLLGVQIMAVKSQDCLMLLQDPEHLPAEVAGVQSMMISSCPLGGVAPTRLKDTQVSVPLLPRSATWCYSQNTPGADVAKTHRLAFHPPHSSLQPRANQGKTGPGTGGRRQLCSTRELGDLKEFIFPKHQV